MNDRACHRVLIRDTLAGKDDSLAQPFPQAYPVCLNKVNQGLVVGAGLAGCCARRQA